MPPRRTGRPPLDTDSRSVPVNVRVPADRYDELFAQARRQGLSVPQVIRTRAHLLAPKVDRDPDDGG
jgi:hypothetical protein